MASEAVAGQAGSISQVRYVAESLMKIAKSRSIPVLLIGHVNKEGNLAGPQVLTHLVDTVLFLEGDGFHQFRLLRATKNRFGAVDEVGVFGMEQGGLAEVRNPSALFLEGRATEPIGSVVVPVLEGTRSFLVEVQALTAPTHFGYPKRTASGFDMSRLNIILAVLERYADLKLDSADVFVNVAGGMRLREPAADLAVAMAVASAKLKKPVPADLSVMGEVGLSGEIRAVPMMERRIKECEKLGFRQIIAPGRKGLKTVADAIALL
jgi:DNA repair protein RadA/Sms